MVTVDLKRSYIISDEVIANLLVCACEGGSNSWYWADRVPYTLVGDSLDLALRLPVNFYNDQDDPEHLEPLVLDRAACEKALRIMAATYPDHFEDVVNENEDAATGDVFLQCALFDRVVFC